MRAGGGVLLAALDRPQHHAGADHAAAQQAGDKVQPAQPGLGKASLVQRIHDLHALYRCAVCRFCRQGLAGVGVEREPVIVAPAHRVAVRPADLDPWRLAAIMLHQHRTQLGVRPPGAHGLLHHVRDGGLRAFDRQVPVVVVQFVVEALHGGAIGAVGRGNGGGHVVLCKEHQPAVGNHQEKRQGHDADDIVGVQPGALTFAWAKGKKVLEDLLVGNDAGDDRDQHQHGADTDQAKGQRVVDVVQGVVHDVQLTSAAGGAWLDVGTQPAGGRVQLFAAAHAALVALLRQGGPFDAVVLPGALGLCPVRQIDGPDLGFRGDLLQAIQPFLDQRNAVVVERCAGQRPLRLHPAGDLVVEIARCAGDKDKEQHPGDDQPGPGVQPGHALAKSFFHCCSTFLGLSVSASTRTGAGPAGHYVEFLGGADAAFFRALC